ncbi:MAG: ABC transporter permease [Planctomycetes bacterium]|nr:ABC transporter permease [Planctomycetota bacterium]
MPAAAVFHREIGEVTRRGGTHAVHAAFIATLACAVLVPCWLCAGAEGRLDPTEQSRLGVLLYRILFGTLLALLSLLAPVLTGGMIAEERRRGTLEILFLTPISPAAILLAKFASRIAWLLLLLLLPAPVLLVCLNFGGVSSEEVWLGAALLGVCAVWTASLGAFFSSLSWYSYQGVVRSYIVLALQATLAPLALAKWSGLPWTETLFLTSPQGYAFARVCRPDRLAGWELALAPPLSQMFLALSALALVLAACKVRRLRDAVAPTAMAELATTADGTPPPPPAAENRWDRRLVAVVLCAGTVAAAMLVPAAAGRLRGLSALPFLALAIVAERLHRRFRPTPRGSGAVWEDPVAWREEVLGRTGTLANLADVTLIVLAVLLLHACSTEAPEAGALALHAALVALEFGLTLIGASILGLLAFSREAEEAQLDLLLVTTLTPRQLVSGRIAGILRTMWPLAAFTLTHAAAAASLLKGVDVGAATVVPLLLASALYLHVAAAVLLGFWVRRTSLAIPLAAIGGLLLHGLQPAFHLLSSDPAGSLWGVRFLVSPLEAVFLGLAAGTEAETTACAALAAACLAVGAFLRFALVRWFDRLARRGSSARSSSDGKPAAADPSRRMRRILRRRRARAAARKSAAGEARLSGADAALLLLAPLLSCLSPSRVEAADDPGLSVEATCGIGGCWQPGRWTPVRVRVENRGPDLSGRLTIICKGPLGEEARYERPIHVPSAGRKVYRLLVRVPEQGSVRARVEGGDRSVTDDAPIGDPPPGPAFVVVGPPDGDAPQLPPFPVPFLGRGYLGARFFASSDDELPDRPLGYDGVSWAIVRQADARVFANEAQAAAYEAWLRAGGRTLIVASAGAAPVRGTVFERILPAELGPMADCPSCDGPSLPGPLAGARGKARFTFPVSTVRTVRGRAALANGARPFLIIGRCGLGTVAFLPFDPWRPPFRGWSSLEPVWNELLQGRSSRAYQPGAQSCWESEVRSFLDSYHEALAVRMAWPALLLAGYVLVLGPITGMLARRAKRPGRVWAWLVACVALFCGAVRAVGDLSVDKSICVSVVSVVDVDGEDGSARGEAYATVTAARSGEFDLCGSDVRALVRLTELPEETPGLGVTPPAEIYDARDGAAVRSLRIAGGARRRVRMSWIRERDRPLPIRAALRDGVLEVRNEGADALQNPSFLCRHAGLLQLESVGPGATKCYRLPAPCATTAGNSNAANHWRFAPRDADWPTRIEALLPQLYGMTQSGCGADFDSSRLDQMSADVAPWLAEGGSVLLATQRASPCALRLAGPLPIVNEACLVRVFLR